jgi:hypothetical protein
VVPVSIEPEAFVVTWSFVEWTPDDSPGSVHDMSRPEAWERLANFYGGGKTNYPLERIIQIARAHGVRSVVVERRYIDLDWRSEHACFYGHKFERFPSVCHRLHFFTEHLKPNLADLGGLQDAYRGYTIMRPLPVAPVGRTMIAPPPELADWIRCEAEDQIDLFGWPFRIRAMPFVSQDAEYLRCAHASLWMVLYHSYLGYATPRRLPGEIQDASLGGVIVGRQVPSEGLSVYQMLGAATSLGLSPGLLPLPTTADKSREAGALSLSGIMRRYVNSNLPPIIISNAHAWVVVAYQRVLSAGHARLRLWRHDDARGPYLPVNDPWNESENAHRPWKAAILPLLPKMYVTGERAEAAGRFWFEQYIQNVLGSSGPLAKAQARAELGFRTYAIRSGHYKEGLARRGMNEDLAQLYRLAHWPRYIWVVEAVDRAERDMGTRQPDVLGEAIFDSTTSTHSANLQRGLLAFHGDHFAFRSGPDYGQERRLTLVDAGAYLSGRPGRHEGGRFGSAERPGGA